MRNRSREDGSLVVALLAAIVVGGLIITLTGTTMTGQRKVRDDRQFQLAINGADAGVNQAMNAITLLPAESTTTHLDSTGGDPGHDGMVELGDVEFDWSATKDTVLSWRITATGYLGDTTRTVEALAIRDPIFFLAAFAHVGAGLKGGNTVLSYSATHANTGNGAMGSNGVVKSIGAGSSHADIIMLMGSNATCEGNVCTSPATEVVGYSRSFDMGEVVREIEDMRAAAGCATNDRAYNAGSDLPLTAGTHCLSSLHIPRDTALKLGPGVTSDNPVKILMTGDVTLGNRATINCGPTGSGCNYPTHRPDSGAVQIYTLGNNVSLGVHTKVAAAIAAPKAGCAGSPSSAQADIYGSLVCNDLTNQGSWNFYFDDRLLDLGSGQYEVIEWREEVGGSTSWPD